MKPATLVDVAELVSRRTGIRLATSENGRLLRALSDEARARGLSPEALAALLDEDPRALQDLVERITVHETSFFRDPGQFRALTEHVLPRTREPLTVWSAGCSNGQEPYSLAMALAEAGLEAWRIIATDISAKAVARTRQGRYRERELRGLDERRRTAYLRRRGEVWEIAPQLRERVHASRHNLIVDPPPFEAGACSIVFCRNVLIYMDPTDVVRFLDRLHGSVARDATLFLGFSESLWQVSERFRLVRTGDAFLYQPNDAPSRGSPQRRAAGATRPHRATRSPIAQPALTPMPDRAELLAAGEAAARGADHASAASAFRSAAYLDPDDPIAHFQLGLALEALDDPRSARRAYASALRTVRDRKLEGVLGGYRVNDLTTLLRDKLGLPS
ncbi:MAG: CheR family methyltransferase [Actinomycetota bacterium]